MPLVKFYHSKPRYAQPYFLLCASVQVNDAQIRLARETLSKEGRTLLSTADVASFASERDFVQRWACTGLSCAFNAMKT